MRFPLLRRAQLSGVVLAAAFLAVVPAAAPVTSHPAERPRTTVFAQNAIERPLLAAINAERQRRGLKPLRPSRALAQAADGHARAMGTDGFFAHESRDGTSASARIRRHYRVEGYGRWLTGETLLWRSPGVGPQEALALWLASAPHRRVLLSPAFREVGIAAVRATRAPGVFGGRGVTIVVADFGARS